MEKLKIYVSGADIHVTVLGKLTAGMVGAKVLFSFTPEWSGLLKTAVFKGSGVSKDRILTGNTVEIPPECIAKRSTLQVGVYGHLADGTIVIPTVMCNGVEIAAGTKPSGDTQSGYTPEKWAQMLGMIGDLSHLTTEDRSTLVAAINEIAGYKGMELDDDQINEVIEYYFAKHPPTIGDMAMTGDLDMGSHRVKNVADPKEDGDAVPLKYAEDHFAPAGYGYGGVIPDPIEIESDDALKAALDGLLADMPNFSARQIRVMHSGPQVVNGTAGMGRMGTLYGSLYKHSNNYAVMRVSGYAGANFQLVKLETWCEVEWLNPPMVLGVEYRTTERSNGQVVYAKRIEYTTEATVGGTGAVDISIPHGIAGRQGNVRVVSWCGAQPLPMIDKTGGMVTLHDMYSTVIRLRTLNFELSAGLTFTFDLYYTK